MNLTDPDIRLGRAKAAVLTALPEDEREQLEPVIQQATVDQIDDLHRLVGQLKLIPVHEPADEDGFYEIDYVNSYGRIVRTIRTRSLIRARRLESAGRYSEPCAKGSTRHPGDCDARESGLREFRIPQG